MEIHEMSDAENLTLECAQEAAIDPNVGIVCAADVVRHAREQGYEISQERASRTLVQLSGQGLLVRLPRSSRGWGQGWDVSYYKAAAHAIPLPFRGGATG